ncbi:MAG: ABC transporter substrate-binding protein [Nocardioidaceae bacterium]|nr:ABC transporter substrate-binding protein [Nocardioidaceae bacterium]
MTRISSTRLAGLACVLSIALLAAGCAAPSDDGAKPAGADGVVKVGFLSPVTGPVAAAGQQMKQGWELYWEQHGNKAGGVKVKTYFDDDAGNPETALTKARRLVENEHVEAMVGPMLANTALAVSDYVTGQGIPSFQPVTAADDLTQRKQNPLMIRTGSFAASQMNYPGGQWAHQQGHRKAATLCLDYAFGWESCAGFVRSFTDAGGTIAKQLWYPLGTQDFSSYMTQLKSVDADMLYIAAAGGGDAPRIISTYDDFGLRDKLFLLANCCLFDTSSLKELGAKAEGLHSVSYYAEGREGSQVLGDFEAAYKAKYGLLPSAYVAGAYVTASVLAAALEKTGGDADAKTLVAAARSVRFDDSPLGPLSYDDMNNTVGNVYIREVRRNASGDYVNVPVATVPDVGQFWKYDKDDYLAQPPYDRRHTGKP